MKRKSPKARAKLILPTAAENAAINRAIKADPATRELTAKDFAQMVPFREMMKRRGRPRSATHKVPVTVRLEPRVVEYFRGSGPGWQTRLSDTLAGYVDRQRRRQAQ